MIAEIVTAICSALPLLARVDPRKKRKREFGLALFKINKKLGKIEDRAEQIVKAIESKEPITYGMLLDQLVDVAGVRDDVTSEAVSDVLDIKAPKVSQVQINVASIKWEGFRDGIVDIPTLMGGTKKIDHLLQHSDRGLNGNSVTDLDFFVSRAGSTSKILRAHKLNLSYSENDFSRLEDTIRQIKKAKAAITKVLATDFDLDELIRFMDSDQP